MPKNDFHAMGIIFNPQGKKIALVKNNGYAGKSSGLGLPGGRSEGEDDDPERRFLAEISEETGLKVKVLGKLASVQVNGQNGSFMKHIFAAVATADGDKNVVAVNNGIQETAGWDWFDSGQPPQETYKSHIRIIQNYLEEAEYLFFALSER